MLARIDAARLSGRKVYLASASHERLVRAIAAHLGCFDGWFASGDTVNLSRQAKADSLTKEFGKNAFDYIGDARADLPVWKAARRAMLARSAPSLARNLRAGGVEYEILMPEQGRMRDWIRLLRPHQWVKNALIFIPLLTAHLFATQAFLQAFAAFIAFSLCASGVYIINDLVDIQADRQHVIKKERPFAKGALPLFGGIILVPVLIAAAFGVALQLSPGFQLALGTYLIITTAYSFFLKRKMLIDVITLALLYSLRVIAGGMAVNVEISQWLLAFSMFLFLFLALVKRYSEMAMLLDGGLSDSKIRNYKASDLPVIAALAAASGYSAVIVFSLYLSSDTVRALYRHPVILWPICPLFLYWISRVLLLSHRRVIPDDPVIFALKDRVSLLTVLLITLLGAAAT